MAAPAVPSHRRTRARKLIFVLSASTILLLGCLEITGIVGEHGVGSEFAGTVYHPAMEYGNGVAPYGDPRLSGPLAASVYPPSAFVPFFWLGFLGSTGAVAVWLCLMAAAGVGTLAVLGVRDPRCYA